MAQRKLMPQFIQTLPRRGYRFVAAVREGIEPEPISIDATPSIAVAVSSESTKSVSVAYEI